MEYFRLYTMIFVLCLSAPALAQTVQGKITAFKKYPLNNVTIKAKKSKEKVESDSLGNFMIGIELNDVISFTARGFEPQRIKVKNKKSIELNLIYKGSKEDYKDVMRGNHLSQETLDYCIEHLFDNNNNFHRMASMEQILKTVYPATLIIREGSIEKVVLGSRGPNSLDAGIDIATSNQALLLVDGIPVDEISSINPDLVKSVKIHVGTSAARWGSRGGNGVVEIFLN